MADDETNDASEREGAGVGSVGSDGSAKRPLAPPARRALAEAAMRRAAHHDQTKAEERGGRGGLEPVRYGDWEVKGLASDF